LERVQQLAQIKGLVHGQTIHRGRRTQTRVVLHGGSLSAGGSPGNAAGLALMSARGTTAPRMDRTGSRARGAEPFTRHHPEEA
jgi:hypothetical protein